MPTIALTSPKGGVGKSTLAAVISTSLAAQGASVELLDADPNQPLALWASQTDLPENLQVQANINEDNILDSIETAEAKASFVIIDLEGTGSLMATLAISKADFILIPMQASQLDVNQASKIIKLIKQSERVLNRTIPFAAVITRISAGAIKPKFLTAIIEMLKESQIPVLNTKIFDKEAFKAIFSLNLTLDKMTEKEICGCEKAKVNAAELIVEVVEMIKEIKARKAA